MPLHDWFLLLGEIGLLIFLVFVISGYAKQCFVTGSGSVGKATDDGETLNLNQNFFVWDSKDSMEKKLKLLQTLGDDRKQWHIDRYAAIFKKAEEEKAADVAAGKYDKKGKLRPVS